MPRAGVPAGVFLDRQRKGRSAGAPGAAGGAVADWNNPVEVAWRTPEGEYEAAEGVRIAACSPAGGYSPVWPKAEDAAKERVVRFAGGFEWDGGDPVRLEYEVAHGAEVTLNGRVVARDRFCVPWGYSRKRALALEAVKGRNELVIAVDNICQDPIHEGGVPRYFAAQVIAGQHSLARTAVEGDFRTVPEAELGPCHNRMRVASPGPVPCYGKPVKLH